MATTTQLEILESRINELENTVFGDLDKDSNYQKCTDSLMNVHTKVSSIASSKKNVKEVFSQLSSLKKYLDPNVSDELTLSQSAKAGIILCQEDFVKTQAGYFEQLKALEGTTDSEHLKAIPNLSGKLQTLSSVHISLQDASVELTDDVKSLLLSYNSIMSLLMKQFLQWDEAVTQMEQAV